VLVSLPRSEIEEAREKNKELRGKTVAGIWDASHEGSVFIVDDGVEPAERYESLKSSLIRFMGENKIAVIERRESLEVDTGLPVLGVGNSVDGAIHSAISKFVNQKGKDILRLFKQDGPEP